MAMKSGTRDLRVFPKRLDSMIDTAKCIWDGRSVWKDGGESWEHPAQKAPEGLLCAWNRDRPHQGHNEGDDDSERDLDESVGGDDPGTALMGDQKHNRERDGGEAVGGAQAEHCAKDPTDENAETVDDPVDVEVRSDEGAEKGTDCGSGEALPGEGERIDRREQDHDGGDGRPVELGEFEALCRE